MQRIGIMIEELHHNDEEMGLTRESLTDVILVALKRDVPKLKIADSPEALASAFDVRITSARIDDYTMSTFVELSILRPVEISGDNGRKIHAGVPVWSDGKMLAGPTYEMASRILEYLNQCLTEFAAQYHKDNP
jgi:hypothetical protein